MWEHLSLAGSAYCCWFSRAPGRLTNPRCSHVGQLNAVETNTMVKKHTTTKPTRKGFLWKSCKRKSSLFNSQQQGDCSAELGLSRLLLLTPYIHTHKNFKNSYMPDNRHTNKTYLNFEVTTPSSKSSRDATDFHVYTDCF